MSLGALRHKIREAMASDEHELISQFIAEPSLTEEQRRQAVSSARELVEDSRADKNGRGPLDSFLLEFGLSNREGVALMCLAESLLRVPDAVSADRLIAEKVTSGDWSSHLGHSDSLFVNSSTWGLLLTGKILQLDADISKQPGGWVKQLSARIGEPVIRKAFMQAMKLMGQHYVLGRNIEEGLTREVGSDENPALYSFDMLGEAARTMDDAARYYDSYARAIDAIGQFNKEQDVYASNGISVKLSALHPRYEFSQRETAMAELLPRIKSLCVKAKSYNLGLSIDAEEARRLDLSLDIFHSLAADADLTGWQGLGFVLQAYQKRAPLVSDWLIELAKVTDRRIMVRLVKGAYWDYEIKHAQEQGHKDYPVFTRKAHTDLCYLYCANKLIDAGKEIYPQFATHNAYTAASIIKLIEAQADHREFEFQRLHGMGDLLYKHLRVGESTSIPLRVYAPIGRHEDLLPYLVRRLLENGANSSFVNRFLDQNMPTKELIVDVYAQVGRARRHRHAAIPLPKDVFITAGEDRKNSNGIDLDCPLEAQSLTQAIARIPDQRWRAACIVSGKKLGVAEAPVVNPADSSMVIGNAFMANEEIIDMALDRATSAAVQWQKVDSQMRSDTIKRVADLLDHHRAELIKLIVTEAGRTLDDSISEVREAIDFCRYYALVGEDLFANNDELQGRGVFLCISPWNFPLAIFVGQIAAALVAGNSVIAKPAAQTPLVAARVLELFHEAGIPADVLHLLIGSGSKIGGRLLPDKRLSGVCFTGSTETAQSINRQLADRPGLPVPLIAETGGQNCLIADSTALPEQLVDDVIASAFKSAGQRCSALRVLFIQEEIADRTLKMLQGAMQSLVIGDPSNLSTDIGPVIDYAAQAELEAHAKRMEKVAKRSFVLEIDEGYDRSRAEGSFFAPRLYEIDSLDQLTEEVFGPILHVIRFKLDKLDEVIRQINQTGYGLTLGIHSRIQAFADHLIEKTRVGNNYINRNMVGAVVGVNPFGGMGLSGTGPKAGGPNYLYRFSEIVTSAPVKKEQLDLHVQAQENVQQLEDAVAQAHQAYLIFNETEKRAQDQILQQVFGDPSLFPGLSLSSLGTIAETTRSNVTAITFPGPTGEENQLSLQGRGTVACLVAGDSDQELSLSMAIALSARCSMIIFCSSALANKADRIAAQLTTLGLPKGFVLSMSNNFAMRCLKSSPIVAATINRAGSDVAELKRALSTREGPLVPLIELPDELKALSEPMTYHNILINLMVEKTRTENLVARGGNTALFCVEDDDEEGSVSVIRA